MTGTPSDVYELILIFFVAPQRRPRPHSFGCSTLSQESGCLVISKLVYFSVSDFTPGIKFVFPCGGPANHVFRAPMGRGVGRRNNLPLSLLALLWTSRRGWTFAERDWGTGQSFDYEGV